VADYQNPCGGKRWRILSSGLIEVEGEGTPMVAPGTASFTQMQQTWRNWGGALERAAAKYNLPAAWLLAVATMETGYLSSDPVKQAQAVSPVGAIGVMQIMPFNAVPFGLKSADELFDPAKNIDVGAQILAKDNQKVEAGGLPGISAMYNSGKLCTTDPARNEWMLLADANYPRHVIEWNNAALASGLVFALGSSSIALLGAAAGAALALAITGARR
jgi:soluble lytic murein transglycosylase-like protein